MSPSGCTAALYPSKWVVVASLPFDHALPVKHWTLQENTAISKKKQRQHSTGSGNHQAVLYTTKLELTMLLLCYPTEPSPSRDHPLSTPLFHQLAARWEKIHSCIGWSCFMTPCIQYAAVLASQIAVKITVHQRTQISFVCPSTKSCKESR